MMDGPRGIFEKIALKINWNPSNDPHRMHCIVPVEMDLEVFNSAAKRWPICEFYGSKFPFIHDLKVCFP